MSYLQSNNDEKTNDMKMLVFDIYFFALAYLIPVCRMAKCGDM